MATEIKVPVLPESVSDATIATWHKQAGDAVKRDENLVDLETDKVVLEVPSTVDGVIKELKFAEGATVTSQQVIAVIDEGAAAPATPVPAKTEVSPAPAPAAAPAPAPASASAPAAATKAESAKPAPAPATSASSELPPGARFTAAKEGVDPADVAGTGRKGAVTKEDIVNYASGKTPGVSGGARPEERVPMTRMRTRIAERLMQSKNSIAMLTSFNEVNLGKVMAMRKELGESFEKANGIKLGFMSFFAKAAANALQRHPIVNASVDGNDVIYHGYTDISIAVSTDKGLVTPVLRNVERMSFADVEKAIAAYATKARDGKLALEDLQGGTFTITNGGTFGSLMSTPIVNPPQSAILGMHAIKERAIVEGGAVIAAPM
ncbi:MAG: dihydrolipoyllysine-residue succinyltransferase, partial [Luteimonas sp.]